MMAGQIDKTQISETAHRLKCVLASLENVQIINPFAPLIELPDTIPHPRKTLLLLLDFINVVTFFHQAQREKIVNEQTGEFYIQTAPQDIELAFSLLKTSLLRKTDDLSTSARGFLSWLKKYLLEAKTKQFTALDIRKAKTIHPRTLNRYLQELNLFHYIQIIGGNKHRGGFIYKLTGLDDLSSRYTAVETSLQNTLKALENSNQAIEEPKTHEDRTLKRVRINDKEEHTLKLILELEAKEPNREYLPTDFTAITGRDKQTEARHLKTLWQQGKLDRQKKDQTYYYTLSENIRMNLVGQLAN
jgi:DNA-binding HxlR family transcriptional regulator